MIHDLKKIRDTWREGSLNGYASGAKPILMDETTREKGYIIQCFESGYMYRDVYAFSGLMGNGCTTIFWRDASNSDAVRWVPVWCHQYWGGETEDNPEARTFLKQTLLREYQANRFTGGRGPFHAESDNFQYHNYAPNKDELPQSFSRFRRDEIIYAQPCDPFNATRLFWHNHQGGLMLQPEQVGLFGISVPEVKGQVDAAMAMGADFFTGAVLAAMCNALDGQEKDTTTIWGECIRYLGIFHEPADKILNWLMAMKPER